MASLAASSVGSTPDTRSAGLSISGWEIGGWWLAASDDAERPPGSEPGGSSLRRGPAALRVLIIEDSTDAAHTLCDLLVLLQYEVQVAHTGSEGLQIARAFQPDVVLCDLGLPGLDGYQVAAALRRDPATARARLIALTGYNSEEARRRSREVGFELHLAKPVDLELLEQLLALEAAALRRRGPEDRQA